MGDRQTDWWLDTPMYRDWRQDSGKVLDQLKAAGLVTAGPQQIDLPQVRGYFKLRDHAEVDAVDALAELRTELAPDGRAVVTLELLERLEVLSIHLAGKRLAIEAVENEPEPDPVWRGMRLGLAGRPEEAVEAFTEAISGGYLIPDIYLKRGRAYQLAGRSLLAMKDYERFLESDELWSRPQILAWRAEVQDSLGNADGAVQSLLLAVEAAERLHQTAVNEGVLDEDFWESLACQVRHVISAMDHLESGPTLGEDGRRTCQEIRKALVKLGEQAFC